ncbi:MAG TPA: fumarylacetoacetase [Ktedonobacterales bacterium]|nr:fumarylacetoacetase [Ktedonobacterales bacterium]
MIYAINETHDPKLTSWVTSANAPGIDFPIQNLPFGVFRRVEPDELFRVGVAIGDQILDLTACVRDELLQGEAAMACVAASMNRLLALGPAAWSDLRRQISALLRADGDAYRANSNLGVRILVPQGDVVMRLPMEIGDYIDGYASKYHATNVGSQYRPDNPLLPNYAYVPIAYHGRASSVVVGGTPVRRPVGQTRPRADEPPVFGPCAQLDYETEVGMIVGPGNALGETIPIGAAERQLFGVCLVNDWSARDIQRWEYQPLGPFLAKSFATSVSPWIVTLEALAPFRAPALARAADEPPPLPYLLDADDQAQGAIALTVEVTLTSERMRAASIAPFHLSRASLADLYWTPAQMVTHFASNGSNLRPGDLLATGTLSGPTKAQRGCLLEITWGGKEPVELPGGEQRRFLEDGDEVIMRAYAERPGYTRIGLGACAGVVLAAGEA